MNVLFTSTPFPLFDHSWFSAVTPSNGLRLITDRASKLIKPVFEEKNFRTPFPEVCRSSLSIQLHRDSTFFASVLAHITELL